MSRCACFFLVANLFTLGAAPTWSEEPVSGRKTAPAQLRHAGDRRAPAADSFDLVSSASLLQTLEDLTTIEAHSGWRVCGSAGEREALAYVEQRLARHGFLTAIGLEIERQTFRTIVGVEIHRAELEIEVSSAFHTVPADATAGHPYSLELTQLYDSDGDLTDLSLDPVVADGQVRALTTLADIQSLSENELTGRIAVLDFALIDTALIGRNEAFARLQPVFEAHPAGLVAVTSDSLTIGESHGSFALDSGALIYFQLDPPIPVLVARIQDLAPAGISTIGDLNAITSARLTWDTDIVSPGQSGNVVARIPGVDSTRATILSAHLDSPNCPGALDNGSGSAALLEVARVLDRSRTKPPVDVYLVWFGCHEKGVFGSAHFAATHQELLDRAIGMIELDAMARPLDGLDDPVNLESWSYSRLGDGTLPFPDFLADQVAPLGIEVLTWDFHWLLSDVSGFVPYDVPNALLDNLDMPAVEQLGSAHYIAHWHSPNDTVEHARAESEQFERLTKVLLSAALDTGAQSPNLRVTPVRSGRAVFLANHTESVHMAPLLFTDLGTILAWEGLDLDLVPYGGALNASDLEDAKMVVVLPPHDYPSELSNVDLYDEAWSAPEIAVLTNYVESGGLLVLANSAARLGPFGRPRESNEDWADLNLIAEEFDIEFFAQGDGSEAEIMGTHELVDGVEVLAMLPDNAIGLTPGQNGQVLATMNDVPTMVLVEYGNVGGEVVALGDVGALVSQGGQPSNFTFWQNLARYAAVR